MQRKYQAFIKDIDFSIELDGNEICTFVTHFGKFGDIQIYDQQKNECVLNTKGVMLDSFYPDMENREMAQRRGRHLNYMFEDYKHERALIYPTSDRLYITYKKMKSYLLGQGKMESPIRVCNHCLSKVYVAKEGDAEYQCFEDNENIPFFQTHEMEKDDYLNMMAEKLNCPRDIIEKVHCEYDSYISKAYWQDGSEESLETLEQFYEANYAKQDLSESMMMKF